MARATGFNHTSFTVSDIDRGVGFWRDVLGFTVADLGPRDADWLGRLIGVAGARAKIAHLHGHGAHVEFIQYLTPVAPAMVLAANRPGSAHVAIEVDDIERIVDAFTAAGGRLEGEIVTCATGSTSGSREAYLRDPNGVLVELIEWPDGAAPAKPWLKP